MWVMHVSFGYVLHVKSEEIRKPVHAHRLIVAIAVLTHVEKPNIFKEKREYLKGNLTFLPN